MNDSPKVSYLIWPILLFAFTFLFFGVTTPSRAAGDEPGSPEQLAFAEELFQLGDYYRSITEYKRFIFQYAGHELENFARLRIVEAYVRGRWWDEGLFSAQDLLDRDVEGEVRVRAMLELGVCRIRLGQLPEAREALSYVEENAADEEIKTRARYLKGEISAVSGRWDESKSAFDAVEPGSGLKRQAAASANRIEEKTPLQKKSPWVAGALAAALPGAGHLYLGRRRDAGLVFAVNGTFIGATAEAIDKGNQALAGALAAAELIWYSGNIFSAVSLAHKHNRMQRENLLSEIRLSRPSAPYPFPADLSGGLGSESR